MIFKIEDIKNVFTFFKFLLQRKNKVEEPILKIKCITYRKFAPNGGVGGGAAALSMQKMVLGNSLAGIPLEYLFYKENKYSSNKSNQLWDLFAAIQFVIETCKSDKNCAYITHDYGTAFGLYLLGKKYISVSHIQGSRVEEKQNFHEKMTLITKLIIMLSERAVYKNAFLNTFPSYGAYNYFCNSRYKLASSKFKLGPIIYNTLWAYPKSEPISDILKLEDTLTILSVGQMTVAKGMDRCPEFMENLLKQTNRKIRYLISGNGPLLNQILEKLDLLKSKYPNFSYKHFSAGLSNENMAYLQEISDVYLMLHRISVFDLATLEMMNRGKAIILSNIGGNPEFNKENNIIIFDGNYNETVKNLLQQNITQLGKLNKQVYNKYFSNEVYKEKYRKIIGELVENK